MKKVLIVSPATRRQNNGNWHTASRWADCLGDVARVDIGQAWQDGDAMPDLLIALHARRSAASLAAFHRTGKPSILVLTGTDVYRDIATDADAQRSLELANHIVVLQEHALSMLPPAARAKASIIYQSAPALSPRPARQRRLHTFVMAGHLRAEKDPQTFIRAAELVRAPSARLVHIGDALEPELGRAARAAEGARYRWLGAQPHGATRRRIRDAHAMAITSVMEGGANVIIEAVRSGVPVLASDIGGNRGMLGESYPGYFPLGDAAALAALIDRTIADPAFHASLRAHCATRAGLFEPARECAAVKHLFQTACS
jgi:putative glycosyltransferase (TIGR04348 family)